MRDLGLAPGQWPVPADRVSGSAPTIGRQRVGEAAPNASARPSSRLCQSCAGAGPSGSEPVRGAAAVDAGGSAGRSGRRRGSGALIQGTHRRLSLPGLSAGQRGAGQIFGPVSGAARRWPEFRPGGLEGGGAGPIHWLVRPATPGAFALGGQ